jgi:hypothetical protein
MPVNPSSVPYTVTVGAGGDGAPAAGTNGQPGGHQYTIAAKKGGNTTFGNLTAIGGGFGGSSVWSYTPGGSGGSGGSGGGASGFNSTNAAGAGLGTSGQGFSGGNAGGSHFSGGGGGGCKTRHSKHKNKTRDDGAGEGRRSPRSQAPYV